MDLIVEANENKMKEDKIEKIEKDKLIIFFTHL